MSYPFYIHAATSSTASQHPCRLFFAAAAVAAPFILISNSAYAALNCTTQPTCEQFGYSKSVDANCDDYILCPFDTSYKKCITGKVDCAELGFTQDDKSEWCNKIVTCQTDSSYTLCAATENCDDFTLSKCPTGANCSSCGIGTDVSYKVDSCKEGYKLSGNTCTVNACTGYTLSKCPTGANCSSCISGSSTKYKLNSCNLPYVKSGNTCYNCSTNKTTLTNKAKLVKNSYLYCCDNDSFAMCRTKCTDYTYYGSYSDGCFPYAFHSPQLSTSLQARKEQCIVALNSVKSEISTHNTLCPSYQVTDNINATSNCNTAVVNGYLSAVTDGGWNCKSSSSSGSLVPGGSVSGRL